MNNDIQEYKTKSGKKRYKFTIYAGKYENSGRSLFVRKKGFLTEQEATKHAALWVKEDLEIERNAFERQSNQNQTILREKRLN